MDTESGDGHILTARDQNGHRVVLAHSLAFQERGYILGYSVYLFVCIAFVKINHRCVVGRFFCLTAEHCHDIGDFVVKFKVIFFIELFKLGVGQHIDLAELFFAEHFGEHFVKAFEQSADDLVVI